MRDEVLRYAATRPAVGLYLTEATGPLEAEMADEGNTIRNDGVALATFYACLMREEDEELLSFGEWERIHYRWHCSGPKLPGRESGRLMRYVGFGLRVASAGSERVYALVHRYLWNGPRFHKRRKREVTERGQGPQLSKQAAIRARIIAEMLRVVAREHGIPVRVLSRDILGFDVEKFLSDCHAVDHELGFLRATEGRLAGSPELLDAAARRALLVLHDIRGIAGHQKDIIHYPGVLDEICSIASTGSFTESLRRYLRSMGDVSRIVLAATPEDRRSFFGKKDDIRRSLSAAMRCLYFLKHCSRSHRGASIHRGACRLAEHEYFGCRLGEGVDRRAIQDPLCVVHDWAPFTNQQVNDSVESIERNAEYAKGLLAWTFRASEVLARAIDRYGRITGQPMSPEDCPVKRLGPRERLATKPFHGDLEVEFLFVVRDFFSRLRSSVELAEKRMGEERAEAIRAVGSRFVELRREWTEYSATKSKSSIILFAHGYSSSVRAAISGLVGIEEQRARETGEPCKIRRIVILEAESAYQKDSGVRDGSQLLHSALSSDAVVAGSDIPVLIADSSGIRSFPRSKGDLCLAVLGCEAFDSESYVQQRDGGAELIESLLASQMHCKKVYGAKVQVKALVVGERFKEVSSITEHIDVLRGHVSHLEVFSRFQTSPKNEQEEILAT